MAYINGKEVLFSAKIETHYEEGYNKGYEDGHMEGYSSGYGAGLNEGYNNGLEFGQEVVWAQIQEGGNRKNYNYAFADGFPVAAYNPRYPLRGNLANAFRASSITDVKVELLEVTSLSMTFAYSKVKRIPYLDFSAVNEWGSAFKSASRLTDLTAAGVIKYNLNLADCPLTVESVKSVIKCLYNFTGTAQEFTYTLTLNDASKTALLNDTTTSPNGNTWVEYIADMAWNLA